MISISSLGDPLSKPFFFRSKTNLPFTLPTAANCFRRGFCFFLFLVPFSRRHRAWEPNLVNASVFFCFSCISVPDYTYLLTLGTLSFCNRSCNACGGKNETDIILRLAWLANWMRAIFSVPVSGFWG